MQKVGCHKDHFDAWAAKLLGQGYAVARVEETSRREGGAHVKDKDGGKGGKGTNTKGGSGSIVEREVSEIYAPALDRGLTREEGARYLLALAELPIEDDGGGAEGGCRRDRRRARGRRRRRDRGRRVQVSIFYFSHGRLN